MRFLLCALLTMLVTPLHADAITQYQLPADLLARATALHHARVLQYVVHTLYGLALLLVVLQVRLAPRYRDLAARATSRRFLQSLIVAGLLMLTLDVLALPLGAWSHQLQRSYGLSVQGWGSWLWDQAKGELVGLTVSALLFACLYALLRRQPRRWWFHAWLACLPLILLLTLVWPVFVSPLFSHFEPLADRHPQLMRPIEQVMARGGIAIERSRMFEMRASDKVTTYNAYVTGIGASKRVVVWDNTARDLSVPEALFIFGHEQGHYALDHIWLGLGFVSLGLLAGLYAGSRLLDGVLRRHGRHWDIRAAHDLASLPVLLLLASLLSLVAQPIRAAFSRHIEHQADIYGLEVIHGVVPDSPQVAAHAFQKLGERALAYPDPHPFFVFYTYDHPTLAERIAFAARYQPWSEGLPNRYIR